MKLLRILMIVVVPAAAASLAGGCSQQGGPNILNPDAVLPPEKSSAAFLDRASSLVAVSQNDAMRGILFLLEGEDNADNFAQRVKTLHFKSVIPAGWKYDASKPLNRGQLAYMIYQACGINGGVILQLTGPSRRYCLRELKYRRIMAEGLANTEVTGMEFVAVLKRADAYIEYGHVPEDSKIPEGG